MQEAQSRVEGCEDIAPSGNGNFAIGVAELQFHPLDVPIAKIAPEKLVDEVAGFMKAKFVESLADFGADGREPRKNPTMRKSAFTFDGIRSFGADLGRGEIFEGDSLGFHFFEVEEKEAGGVPDFIGEGAGAQDAVIAE